MNSSAPSIGQLAQETPFAGVGGRDGAANPNLPPSGLPFVDASGLDFQALRALPPRHPRPPFAAGEPARVDDAASIPGQ
jgi:hypothetical protein